MSDLKKNTTRDTDDSTNSDASSSHNDDANIDHDQDSKDDDEHDESSNSDSDDDDDDGDSSSALSEINAAVDNPFHLNLDFDELMQRRERAKAARQSGIISITTAGIDGGLESRASSLNDNNRTSSYSQQPAGDTKTATSSSSVTQASSSIKKYETIKPNIVIARAKKEGEVVTGNLKNVEASKARNFFGFGGTNTGSQDTNNTKNSEQDIVYEEAVINLKPIDIGKRSIAIWPYDDYHVIQKNYYSIVRKLGKDYETFDHYRLCKLIQQNTNKKVRHYAAEEFDALQNRFIEQSRQSHHAAYFATNSNMTMPIFARPADPPDLAKQVQSMKLTSFEEVAVERAIAIVSTWLFDVGLIDELLSNGGAVGRTTAAAAAAARAGKGGKSTSKDVGTKKDITKSTSRKGRKGNWQNDRNDVSFLDDDSERSTDTLDVLDHIQKIQAAEDADDLLPTEEDDITKMDREITKLRNSTKRALALINARLNDSVVAIGSEVQELVNAVVATKDDISRLRDLSSYIHNAGADEQTSQQFMLTKYPKLKQAINARRNLSRVFRELDFFAQIPITCDRLREEMHDGEWTANEFSSLRSVAREHVDLEIFLVEAEAGMKKRMEEEEAEYLAQLAAKEKARGGAGGTNAAGAADRARVPKAGRNNFGNVNLPNSNNYALIDRFLEEHVKNVWEMGEEISIRIMNGIATSFELSLTNPAGMVALVEAVEVYESANADYKAVHGEEAGKRNQKLQFTGMRAEALALLYRDFEARCTDVFTELSMQQQAADNKGGEAADNDEEASNKQFSAILRAANELGSEITIVKEKMAPCFPDNWAITTLWTTCVAHVCSNNIMQQIGGPEGHNLPDLSLKQLLDLVAWVETFRQTINEIFPDLVKVTASKRSYLDKPPKLLVENSKMIDVALAEDSLVWVNNTLWNIHNMAKDEFLFKTKEMAEVWLERGYSAEREVMQGSDGKFRTAFSEDMYSMTSIHLRTIRERLTRQSEALVQAVGVVFKILFDKQSNCRDSFCTDFQTCCAAANDFLRMSDKCEEMIDEIKTECNLSSKATEILDEQSAALLGIYSSDAVYAAKKTQSFCYNVIVEEVAEDFFTLEWEEELTSNELAHALVHTLDECMEDVETNLDELMVSKVAEAQVSMAVNFYISCLLRKGSAHNNSKKSMFKNNEIAIERMQEDADVLKSYFKELALDHPTLGRIIEDEFATLDVVFKVLLIAAGLIQSETKESPTQRLKECVTPLQKRLKSTMITKFIVGDLWHIVNPAEERVMYDMFETIEDSLNTATISKDDKNPTVVNPDRNAIFEIRLDLMLAKHVESDTRKRPIKPEAMKKAEGALRGWGLLRKKVADDVVENAVASDDSEKENDDK